MDGAPEVDRKQGQAVIEFTVVAGRGLKGDGSRVCEQALCSRLVLRGGDHHADGPQNEEVPLVVKSQLLACSQDLRSVGASSLERPMQIRSSASCQRTMQGARSAKPGQHLPKWTTAVLSLDRPLQCGGYYSGMYIPHALKPK